MRFSTIANSLILLLAMAHPAAAGYILATAVTFPGSNPAHNGPVLLYELEGTGPLTPLPVIPGRPTTAINDPYGVAFNSRGELFVGNRHGNVLGQIGSIARFTFDASDNWGANGVITGNGLEAVHGLEFSPTGELFAANYRNGVISRFLFNDAGNAVPNGTINTLSANRIDLAFSPDGELFVSTYADIRRYRFDATGSAIANGTFSVPGSPFLHGLEFNANGELFVADLGQNHVYRYLFDASGAPVLNGAIAVPSPIGLAFSPEGELFVSRHGDVAGGLSRFVFDSAGNAVPNGTIFTGVSLGEVTIFTRAVPEPISPQAVPEPSSAVLFGVGSLTLTGFAYRRISQAGARRRSLLFCLSARPFRRGGS